jgi:arylsulfatase
MRPFLTVWALIGILCGESLAADAKHPNILFLLADDLGYGELGCYGQQKIRTPHLDQMAAEGMRFTQFYSGAPVCAPSRCVLMTGRHLGHATIRDNRQAKPGAEGQEPIPDETVTLAETLQAAGYTTGAMGKWGLGPPGSSGDPNKQGFDLFFGYNCQGHAHNFYPTYLWRNDQRVTLNNPDFSAHQKLPPDADPNDPTNYRQYIGSDYAPDRMIDEALGFIRRNKDRPFFLYYPTTVPHLAIQVPEDSLAEYRGQWPDPPYPGGKGYLPHPSPRAGYAAMVTRMDRDIGRMLALLKELGLDDNTLVMFTSDNGPTYDRLGGSDSEFFESNGPLSGLKGSVYEGGMRVPLIARWPGRIPGGRVSDLPAAFYDVLPTLAEVAGTAPPKGVDGISFLPTLTDGGQQKQHEFLVWEFHGYGGQQAVRMGRWKGIRLNCYKDPDGPILLYDLENDLAEERDVAEQHPEVVLKMAELLKQQHSDSAIWDFRKGRPKPPATRAKA